MFSNKGFTLIETLVAFTIVVTSVMLLFPIISLLSHERKILLTRQEVLSKLHDHMQPYIWEEAPISKQSYIKAHGDIDVKYTMAKEGRFIKGCVDYVNVKNEKENHCLYAYKAK